MDAWTELTQVVTRARIRALELEAANERLAATAHASSPTGIRPIVGRLLIRAGQRIAGESAVARSPAAWPVRPTGA
jgi:hypothetical protein